MNPGTEDESELLEVSMVRMDQLAVKWWDLHDNIVQLAWYMVDHDYDAETIAEMIEKPWKWEEEYKLSTIVDEDEQTVFALPDPQTYHADSYSDEGGNIAPWF